MSWYRRNQVRRLARNSLMYAGRMHYTEGPGRRELFHRPKGDFLAAGADCSQYSASLLHWIGVRGVTDQDFTGTLCTKGRKITKPQRGAFVFFGSPPFVHMGVLVKPLTAPSWHVIGFGEQQGPDENTLPGMLEFFRAQGHPGHEFRDLT